jgi:hypothetical protein
MALLSRKRLLLAATESEYGVDAVPEGSNGLEIKNLEVTPLQADVVSRDLIRPYLGNFEQLLAQTRVEMTFEVELAGPGTNGVAPALSPLLKACGMSETIVAAIPADLVEDTPAVPGSVSYSPVSESFNSVTLYVFVDKIRHRVTGARGSFSINCQVGQIPTLNFTFMGIYNDPTDETLPTPVYNQATPQIFKAGNTTGFSLFSYSGCLQSLELDLANEMVYRELVGCTKSVLITDRKPAGTVVIEAPDIDTKDFFTIANSDTLGAMSFTHGTNPGNIVTVNAPYTDIGSPTYGDQDGIVMLNLPFVATPSSAGNDELELTFT